MGTEIQKSSKSAIETVRGLYLQSWERTFAEIMDVLAESYGMELSQEVAPGQFQATPTLLLWKEALKELSPDQMREGLKNYMLSERSSFRPQPGEITRNAGEAFDKPKLKTDKNCPRCGGSGWEQTTTEAVFTGTERAVRACRCRTLVYEDVSYQVRRLSAGDVQVSDSKAIASIPGADKIGKKMPEARPIFPDIDPDRNRATLEKQKVQLMQERARASAGDRDE